MEINRKGAKNAKEFLLNALRALRLCGSFIIPLYSHHQPATPPQ
jgi:hypothetical protein